MLKMRMMFGLIAVVMVLALAQSGYSQLSITATSTPNPTADIVGFNEPTYNPNAGYGGLIVTGTVLSDAPFTGGRLRITYPSAITNACTASSSTSSNGCFTTVNGPGQNVPGIDCPSAGTGNTCTSGVQIIEATGVFSGSSIASINAASGTVDITLPCTTNTANALAGVWNPAGGGHIQGSAGTLILTGVRIDATTAAGLPAGPAVATLSLNNSGTGIANSTFGGGGTAECASSTGAGSGIVLNTTSVNVITASAPGIGAVAIGGIPTSVGQPSGSNASNQGVGTTAGLATGAPCLNTSTIVNPARTVSGFYTNCGVATVFTNKTVQKQFGSFTVKEGFNYAWYHNDATNFTGQDLTPGGGIQTNDASFQLIFNNVPSGVTLTVAVAAFTGAALNNGPAAGAPTFSGSGATATITTANNTATVVWGGDLDPTSTDWVTFEITNVQVSSSSSVVLTPTNITVSAQMFPTETTALNLAKGAGSTQLWGVTNQQFPAFAPSVVTGPTVVTIIPANTTLLIPFAVAQGAFDTGIAIANTSADPFGTQGATPQSGTVTVSLFPSTATGAGTSVGFTTSATKLAGTGIAADGTVPAGATWTVNLSQLLPLAGQTGGFIGYIFIQANFLPAHGAAYVYNGTGFTSSTPVLVVPPPSTNGRNGNNASLGAEVLDF